jgi:putative oxidoreductase
MVIAIVTVHLQNGLFMSNNGYEFGLSLLAISVALVFSGAGRFAIDNVLADVIGKRGLQSNADGEVA